MRRRPATSSLSRSPAQHSPRQCWPCAFRLRFNNGPENQISLPHLRLEGMGITGCKSDMRQLRQGHTPEHHQGLGARELISYSYFCRSVSCRNQTGEKNDELRTVCFVKGKLCNATKQADFVLPPAAGRSQHLCFETSCATASNSSDAAMQLSRRRSFFEIPVAVQRLRRRRQPSPIWSQ